MQAPLINLWPMPIGAAVVVAAIIGIAAWQRRQRELRRERPPISRKLLRPPGHTLSVQLEAFNEKLLDMLGMTAVAGAIAVLLLTSLFPIFFHKGIHEWIAAKGLQNTLLTWPLLPALVGNALFLVVSFCAAVWGIGRCLELIKKIRVHHLGLRGEQAVAEALTEAAGMGYRSFHDFPAGENWNIDHVVVGPGGVFAIETKTKSKRKAPSGMKDHEVAYDGTTLQFPWGQNREFVEQARRNAKTLSTFLGKATGTKVWVTAVLVLPGWYVVPTSNPLTHEVRVMPETALGKYLRGQPQSLSNQQIEQIAFQVEQTCRDVDF